MRVRGLGESVQLERDFPCAGVRVELSRLLRLLDGVLEDGVVYHAYSAYARGLDGLWGMYQWLDRAPKGRNETGLWWRRHDEYNKG